MRVLLTLTMTATIFLSGGTIGQTANIASSKKIESNYQKARRIVYSVFPASTEQAALRVVACETGNTFDEKAYNKSGATGYFQVLTGNGGRKLYGPPTWSSSSRTVMTIDAGLLKNPWYNTLVAFYLSKGGVNWSEWVCKP